MELGAIARLHHDRVPAMPADVDEAVDFAVIVARQYDRNAGNVADIDIARFREIAAVCCKVPRATMNSVSFNGEDFRIGIPTRRQQKTGVDLAVQSRWIGEAWRNRHRRRTPS